MSDPLICITITGSFIQTGWKNSLMCPLRTGNPEMYTLANSEDPDEMLHKAAFHQDLHRLLRQNQSSEKENQIYIFFKLKALTLHYIQWTNLT